MWPKLTNIDSTIARKIKSYSDSKEASNLVSWIRVFSGAVKNNKDGLILQSNTDINLLRAAGETSATIYGDPQSSGIIGLDWGGNPVESNSTRVLRPSPIITGFSSKEGQDQISREATLQIKAFTLEQMEEIQSYFLEPGYTLFIEWGWNTDDGASGFTKITDNGNKKSSNEIVKDISKKSLNYTKLQETRKNTFGEYDAFLGFIVGGSVQSSGDTFDVEVRLRGEPSLPTYMQSYRNSKNLNQDGTDIDSTDKVDSLYSPEELTDENIAEDSKILSKRRFRYMFNELPSDKQLKSIRELEDSVTFNQFINFDKAVEKKIVQSSSRNAFVDSDFTQEDLELKKEDLFSKNKYIRMDLAVDILNIIGNENRFVVGDKSISFHIDINDTVIGGFPKMFSTKASKLIIPGELPDFTQYFLSGDTIFQRKDGTLVKAGTTPEQNGEHPPIPNSDSGLIPFLGTEPLNGEYKEDTGYYGYLKYLFVNFDVFKNALNKKLLNSREVFISILNELSSAVNAYWKFQIVEGEYKETQAPQPGGDPSTYIPVGYAGSFSSFDWPREAKLSEGDVIIKVIDENFIGELPKDIEDGMVSFQHNGVGAVSASVFLNANLDISLPSSMIGQVVSGRLGKAVNPDENIYQVGTDKFFTSERDLFMLQPTSKKDKTDDNTNSELTPLQEIQQKLDNEFEVTAAIDPVTLVQRTIVKDKKTGNKVDIDNRTGRLSQRYWELVDEKNEIINKEGERRQSNLQGYLDKLDVVPLSYNFALELTKGAAVVGAAAAGVVGVVTGIGGDTIELISGDAYLDKNLTDVEWMKKRFAIHCFDDSDFFDLLKQHYIRTKGKNKKSKSLTTIIPIKYTFDILGNSGIKRGDIFRVNGIPEKYSKFGIFQVTEIEHTLQQSKWITKIGGLFRAIQ